MKLYHLYDSYSITCYFHILKERSSPWVTQIQNAPSMQFCLLRNDTFITCELMIN